MNINLRLGAGLFAFALLVPFTPSVTDADILNWQTGETIPGAFFGMGASLPMACLRNRRVVRRPTPLSKRCAISSVARVCASRLVELHAGIAGGASQVV